MKICVVSMNDLLAGNKQLCLSALRATDNCIKCSQYGTCKSRKRNKGFEKARKCAEKALQSAVGNIVKIMEDYALLDGASIRRLVSLRVRKILELDNEE